MVSGAMRPARAPPSIDMLQMVIRCSIESASMADPRYSKTWPVPPATPIRAAARGSRPSRSPPAQTAFDVDLVGVRAPLEQALGREDHLDLARADPERQRPNAPWVEVCESPHTIVIPGCVRPSCGPMTCTIPWLGLPMPCSGIPNSRQLVSSWATWAAAISSRIGRFRGVVGMEWSAVATVRSGWRTVSPRRRRPVNAAGSDLVDEVEVDREDARAPLPSATTWSSQIFSTSVRGVVMAAHSARRARFRDPSIVRCDRAAALSG